MSNTTRQPVAWLVLDRDGYVWDCFTDDDAARKCAMKLDGTHVPLYRDPPPATLTDAEWEAVSIAAGVIGVFIEPHATTLRGLLARLGGDA